MNTAMLSRTGVSLLVLSVGIALGLVVSVALGSGQEQIQGDLDCDGEITSRDNQGLLRAVLDQNALSQSEPCTNIGSAMIIEVASTPSPGGLSRDNPASAGQPFRVPEGWELTIVSFVPDATQEVLDENQFNDPPAPGKRFSIVRVRTENVSAGNPGDPDINYALRMVGSMNIGYSTFENSCGVVPDSFTFKPDDVFQGGSLEGNVCYEAAIGESGFVIYTNYFLGDDEDVRWLEVN